MKDDGHGADCVLLRGVFSQSHHPVLNLITFPIGGEWGVRGIFEDVM